MNAIPSRLCSDFGIFCLRTTLFLVIAAGLPLRLSAADDVGNTPDNALAVSTGVSWHWFESASDVDVFKVSLQGGTDYSIAFSPREYGDAELILYDSDAVTVLQRRRQATVFTPPANGDYYVSLQPSYAESAGVYALVVQAYTGDDHPNRRDLVGSGDQLTAADHLGQPVAGLFEADGDSDFFSFQGIAGRYYQFEAAPAYLRVYDASGAILTPGLSSTVYAQVPESRAGLLYVEVRQNYQDSYELLIEEQEIADVQIDSLSVDLPARTDLTLGPNERFTVTVALSNPSGTDWAVGDPLVALYLSTDETLSEDDVLIGNRALSDSASKLPAGGTTEITQTVYVQSSWPEGSYYVLAQVNPQESLWDEGYYNPMPELDRSNNIASAGAGNTITLDFPEFPDLQVTALDVQPSTRSLTVDDQTDVTVSWTVENFGSVAIAADASWPDAIYLTADPTGAVFDPWSDVLLGRFHSGGLDAAGGANSSYSDSATVSLPHLLGGPYYLVVDCDAGYYHEYRSPHEDWGPGYLPEGQNEKNNKKVFGPIEITQLPQPDLTIANLALAGRGPSLAMGEAVTLTYDLVNQGQTSVLAAVSNAFQFASDQSGLQSSFMGSSFGSHSPAEQKYATDDENAWGTAYPGQLPAGTYTFIWETSRGNWDSQALEAWIDNVPVAAGVTETFAAESLPSGWYTDAHLPWSIDSSENSPYGQVDPPSYTLKSPSLPKGATSRVWTVVTFDDPTSVSFHRRTTAANWGAGLRFKVIEGDGVLEPGESLAVRAGVTVPSSPDALIGSDRHLMLTLDSNNSLVEEYPDGKLNNWDFIGPVEVIAPSPDLQITDVRIPAGAENNSTVDVSYDITNLATADKEASGWISNRFQYSEDGGSSFTLLGTVSPGSILLQPGDTQTVTQSFSIPPGASSWTIRVEVDVYNASGEIGAARNNNTTTFGPFEFADPADAADLVPLVDAEHPFVFPEVFNPADSLVTSWHTANVAPATIPAQYWYDRVYLSEDTHFDPDTDLQVAYYYHGSYDGPLAVGSSVGVTGTASYNAASLAPGSYYVFLRVDGEGRDMVEFNDEYYGTDNNTYLWQDDEGTPKTTQVVATDLVPTAMEIPSLISSSSVSVTATVLNDGDGSIPADKGFSQKLVLSTNTVFGDADDTLWGSNVGWYSGGVPAGETVAISASVDAPNVPAGIYYVFVVIDSYNSIPELNADGSSAEDNNVFMRPSAVEIVQPDLVVTDLSWAADALFSRSAPASVSVTLTNANAGSARNWQDRLFLLAADGTATAVASHYHSESSDGLFGPGETRSYTLDFTMPSDLPVGDYQFRLDADSGTQVVESSETNNSLTSPSNFELKACDFDITGLTVPATVKGGTSMSLEYTLRNRGEGSSPDNDGWYDRIYLSTSADSYEASDAASLLWHPAYDGGGPIPPGESRSVQASSIWVSETQPVNENGQFFVHILADAGEHVAEHHSDGAAETNNHVVSQPISQGTFDLVVTTPASPPATDALGSAETPLLSGATLEVPFTVANEGNFRASGTWADDIHFSLDANTTISAGDIRLSRDSSEKAVDGGSSYSGNVSVELPDWRADWDNAADFFIKVQTDALNSMNEYNETDGGEGNNLAVYRLHFAEAPAVDLQVTDVTVPGTPVPDGGTARITFDITNNGQLDADSQWIDRVTIHRQSDDAVVHRESRYSYRPRDTFWTRGQWETRTVPLTAGKHTLTWVFTRTSSYGAAPDSAYLDNIILPGIETEDFEGVANLADVGFVSSTDEATRAEHWRVEDDGTNAFATAGPAAVGDIMMLTYTGSFTAGDLVYDARIDSHSLRLFVDEIIPAGETRRFFCDWEPPDGASGDYYAVVDADASRRIDEPGHEDNNTLQSDPFSVALQPYPDLQVDQAVVASGTVQTGSVIEVEWTVSNHESFDGGAAASGSWRDYLYLSEDDLLDPGDTTLGARAHEQGDPGLAVGSGYTESLSFKLPDGPAKTWYVFVVTDSGNRVFEHDLEGNNTLATPLRLDAARGPYPDLLPFHIGVPDSIGTGSDFTAYWKVENAGDGVPSSNWYDSLYLSTNDSDDLSADSYLGQKRRDGVNMPFSTDSETSFYTGESTVDIGWHLDPGTYFLKVKVDSNGRLFEYNSGGTGETNNILVSEPFTVTETPTPNLVVTKVRMESLEMRGAKLQMDVEWTVKNIGTASTGQSAWEDHLYLSTTTNLYGQKTRVAMVPNQSYLGAGDSYTQTREITIPWEFAEGDYYLVVMTDARGTGSNHDVVEYQAEDDNVSFSTNAAGQPFSNHIPFLVEPHAYASVLSSFSGDETYPNVSQEAPLDGEGDIVVHTPIVTTGQRVSASWTVRNTGNAAMTGNHWDDAWALSTDPYYDRGTDFWLGSHNYHDVALAAGQYDRLVNNVSERSIPITLPAGEYYLLIVADTHSFGSKYSGNIGVAPTKVIVHQAPPADLLVVPESIQCISPESEWRTGGKLTFRWRVENRGWWPSNENSITSRLSLLPVEATDPPIQLDLHRHNGRLDIVPSPSEANDDWYYEVETSWVVPLDLVPPEKGTRSFRIQVTAGENNFEGAPEHYPNAKDNNTAKGPQTLTITAEDPGDFLPTELKLITPAGELKPGGKAELQWTVKNNGPETMDAGVRSWLDTIYLAPADDPSDRQGRHSTWISSPDDSPMKKGDSYTLRREVRLPHEFTMERAVFVLETDSGRHMFEKYETNNEFVSEPILLPGRAQPDLSVSAPVLSSGTSYQSGDELSFTYSVTNKGGDVPLREGRWTDRIVLSADTVLGNDDDRSFTTHRRNSGLPGLSADGGSAADSPEAASYTVTKHVQLPEDMEGTWYLFAKADDSGNVTETDEQNNHSGEQPVEFSVTLAPAPDLLVSSIDWTQTEPNIAPDGEGNPATVLAGQTIRNVQFTVSNQSSTAATGETRWVDAVYLSRDRILGGGDRWVASHEFSGNLAAGASYAQPAAVDISIPTGTRGEFFVIVKTDSGNRNGVNERAGESNNVLCSDHSFMVELPTNSAQEGDAYFDLQVDSVVPSQGRADIPIQPGQDMRVVWSVTNAGSRAIQNAAWNDAVYLSADAEWDSGDTFVGSVRVNSDLPAGQSYTQDVTFPLPAIDEGTYFVIVRSDVRQNIPEPMFLDPVLGNIDLEENNEGASSSDALVDTSVPYLEIEDDVNDLDGDGITHKDQVTASINTEEALYFRVDTEVGFDLRVDLTCTDRAASTELFVKYGGIPSPADADYVFTNHFRPDQEIIVPGTRAGSYYIMVRGDDVPNGPADFTLTVNYLSFEILTVEPAAVGNAGPSTFTLDGAMFTPGMEVVLRSSGGTEIPASEQFFVSPNQMHATIDLAGAAVGAYDMVLKSADSAEGGEAVLAGAVTVSQGRGGRLTTRLIAPNAVRPGNQHLVWVEYANLGDADVPAPLLHLSTRTQAGVDVRLFNDDPWRQDFIELLGINRAGPVDRIPPGASFALPATFRVPAVGRHTFIVKILDTIEQSLDWSQMETSLANEDASESEQAAMLRYLRGHYGTTYRSFAEGLRRDALRRWRQGQPDYDVRALLRFAAARGYENNISAISGFLRDEETGSALSYVPLALFSEDGDIYSGATDVEGAFRFAELPPGTFELFTEGYILTQPITAQVTRDSDRTDILATGFSAAEEEAPSAKPLQPADKNVSMTRSADGKLHLVWTRNRQIWHAVRDADSASWIEMSEDEGGLLPGAAIPGARGLNPQVLQGATDSTRLAGGEIVVVWRTGADPEIGLNASHAKYVIGRPLEDPDAVPALQYEWTQPADLTRGQYGDTQLRALLTADGQILTIFLQQDWTLPGDDPDLYFKTLDLPANPVFQPPPLRNSSMTLSPSRSAVSADTRDGKQTVNTEFSKDFGSGSVPSFVPLIGGEYGAKAKGSLALELQKCSVSGKAQLGGEAITPRFTFSGSAEMSSGWKASKKNCRWMFNGASLALTVGGETKIPFNWPPPPLTELEVGAKLGLQASGKVTWQGANAGGKSRDTALDMTLQGGVYGEAIFLKDWLEAQVDGSAFVTGDYRVKEGFGVKEYGLKASASVSSWFTKYTFEKEWKKSRDSRGLNLGVSRSLLDEDTLRITRREYRSGTLSVENLTISRAASTGTGNDYSEDGAIPLEGLDAVVDDPDDPNDPWNGVIDANPTLAGNADGSEILAVWVQESGNMLAAEGSGTNLMLARYTPGRSGSWTLLPPLEDAYHLNRAPVIVYDSNDDPWVFWTRSKADVSFSSSVTDIYEATVQTDICYTKRSDGAWSTPAVLAELPGPDGQPAAAASPGGNMAVAWVNRQGDYGSEKIVATLYDGGLDAWDTPEIISDLPLREEAADPSRVAHPAVGYDSLGNPLVSWSHKVVLSGDFLSRALATAQYSAAGGWQMWSLLRKQNDSSPRGDPSLAQRAASRGISPPWEVPEDCCEKEEEEEEEKPEPDPKPDPPDPREDDDEGDDDDGEDWDGDDEHDFDGTESADPNEKHGPAGFGDRHAVAADATMSYTIMFENKSDAGPASVVRVTDQLEEGFDLRRFRLGEFAWGDTIIEVPENRPFHLQSIRLDNGMDLSLLGTVDPRTRLATWEFRTIDPETGQIPDNPLLGFLPPNDDNHAGEGHVTFFITPGVDIVGGTEVKNDATIIFDTNEAIITNETSHLVTRANLDSGVGLASGNERYSPASRAPVVETFDGDFLSVAWGVHEGSDAIDLDAPGAGFNVYYAVGDGPYTLWKSSTKETSASLAVTRGLTYRFYSVARDGAGNSEEAPEQPDLTVRILHDTISISGLLTYSGGAPGALKAVLIQEDKALTARTTFTQQAGTAGGYAFPAADDASLPGENALYSLSAFVDVDGDGVRDPAEPFAVFDGNRLDPVGRSPDIRINLRLQDVDSDGDGLPDWWEQERFGTLDAEYFGDVDGDGVPTGIELAKGTDPNDPADAPTKGISSGRVAVAGGQLYVDNAPFTIRGVLLRSVPPGFTPDTVSDADRAAAIKRDIPLAAELGANTLRTTQALVDEALLDACAAQGLQVIVGIAVDPGLDLTDATVRAAFAADFADSVAEFAGHEALLMWCIGDGVNEQLADEASRTAWYQLLNLLGWVAYEVEGQDYHPVTTANAGLAGVQNLSGLDAWGINAAGTTSFENRADTLFADYAALGLEQPMWLSSYGVSAWNSGSGREDELSQAETDLALAQAVAAAAGNPGVFTAGDVLLATGDAQDVAVGDPGIRANLAFDDADGNGRPGAGEAIWADAVDSQTGVYESGFDADVPLDGVAPPADGTPGLKGRLAYHDANGNGQWDAEEDVWLDTDAEGGLDRVFDDRVMGTATIADTLVYSGTTVEVVDGTPGMRGVFFADSNGSGDYDMDEPVWSDRTLGASAVFDTSVDTLLAGAEPADGTAGSTRGLFLADTGTPNGVWDAQEDVWFAEPGKTLGGVVSEFLDVWSAAGSPAVQDQAAAEYYGLIAHARGGGQELRLRLAYQTLRNLWSGGSPDNPVIADTQVVTNEDEPVTFSVRARAGANHEFRLRKAATHGAISGWSQSGALAAVTYTPAPNFAGADRITYDVVNTATRTSESGSILIQVLPQDDPPEQLATDPNQAVITVAEDSTLILPVTVVEPDGDPVSIEAGDISGLTGAALSETSYDLERGVWQAVLSWTPSYDVASLTQPEVDLPVTFAASDGAAGRTTVTLERTLRVSNVNRAPTAPDAVSTNPDRPQVFANRGLGLDSWSYSDPDGDPQVLGSLQTRWYRRRADRGEEMLADYSNETTLPAGAAAPGDVVFCRVWPSDGADPAVVPDDQVPEGSAGQSPDVEILNDLDSVVVSPASARTADDLTAQPQWLAPDLPTSNVQIQWLETTGGGETAVGTDGTLASDHTSRGRSFVVRATAYREITRGETMMSVPVDSPTITIADTPPPSPENVAYDTTRPQDADPVQVLVGTVPEDADGDTITLEYQWSLDPSFTEPPMVFDDTLPADSTKIRDQWIARVRSTAPDGTSRGTAASPWVILDPVSIGLVTQDLNLTLGWNLLSFAVVPVDDPNTDGIDETTADGLFGDLKFGPVWYWRNDPELGGNYLDADSNAGTETLRQLQGFWLYHTPSDSRAVNTQLPVDGWALRTDAPDDEDSLTLQPGWNIVGVPEDTETIPDWLLDDRISLPLWYYSNIDGQGSYQAETGTEGLKKGIGYWIYLHGENPLPIDMTPARRAKNL